MTVSILGCGWFGFALAKSLMQKGIIVKGSTTSADKLSLLADAGIDPYLIDLNTDTIMESDFFACDVLWICIPPKARSGQGAEYLDKLKLIATAAEKQHLKQLVLISSTSVYAETNTEVTELSETNPNTESGRIMLKAEKLLKLNTAFTTTIIRFAGLIGPGRYPGKFFAGKTDVPNGNAPVNLIHLTDCIGISEAILDQKAFGHIYNACLPNHPTRAEFYTKAAVSAGLEAPHFINEKNRWKIISGNNVTNVLNYTYQIGNLISWLDKPVE